MEIKDLFLIKLFFITILASFFLGCQEMKQIESSDSNISMSQGQIFYYGKPFNGKIKQENPTMEEEYFVSYKNGWEDGEFIARKKSGQLLERRFFVNGVKHGIHRSWFPNGNNRLYSEFDNGKYVNDRWEWYDNGKPALFEKFDSKGKILVTKKWYKNGNIYMNIAFTKTGASVGMPGSKLCDPIKPKEKKSE